MKTYSRWRDGTQGEHRGCLLCPEPMKKQQEWKAEDRCGPCKKLTNLVTDKLRFRNTLNLRSFLSISRLHHFFHALFCKFHALAADWDKFESRQMFVCRAKERHLASPLDNRSLLVGVNICKRKKNVFPVDGAIYSVYFLNTFILLKSQPLILDLS